MKSIFFKILIAGLLIPLSSPAQQHQEEEQLNWADTTVLLASYFALNFALGLAHQVGPLLVSKLFASCGAQLAHSDETSKAYINQQGGGTEFLPPEFKNELLNAMVAASAPISGLIGCILALKGTNIAVEYNKSGEWKKAIPAGLRKELFNDEQPAGIKGWVALHMAMNTFDCIPRNYEVPHEYSIGGNTGAKVDYFLKSYFQQKSLSSH